MWAWQGFRIRGLWNPTKPSCAKPSRRHPDPAAQEIAQELAHRVFNAGAKPRCSKPSRRHREAMFYVELLAEGGAVGSAVVALWRRMRRWWGHRPAVRRVALGRRWGGAKPMAQKMLDTATPGRVVSCYDSTHRAKPTEAPAGTG